MLGPDHRELARFHRELIHVFGWHRVTPRLSSGLKLRILGEVGRPRADVQLAEHRVVPLLLFDLRHLAFVVVEVAEVDRLRRARGLARGDDLAVLDLPPFSLAAIRAPLIRWTQ